MATWKARFRLHVCCIKMELSGKSVYGPVLKTTQLSAITGSNFGNLTAFRAIFSHIFTAHAQERPLMNLRLKF